MSTSQLPDRLYTQSQARELDRQAIAGGIEGAALMQRAGRAAYDLLREHWPDARRIAVYCGGGNNGGDGYVVARLALDAGMVVYLYHGKPAEELPQDARAMADSVLDEPALHHLAADDMPEADIIVDGLLGIGIKGAPRQAEADLIQSINTSGIPVFSLDLPSGLNGDKGHASGAVINADVTLTFIAVKKGLLTGQGVALAGQLFFDDLQVPSRLFDDVTPAALLARGNERSSRLPTRLRHAHKGMFGHVLLVGGDWGYGGAIIMAARAALRSGAGLVSVATRPEHRFPLLAQQPEIMVHGVETADELAPLLEKATALVVGPGLGQAAWGQALLGAVLAYDKPQLLDADAINLVADARVDWAPSARRVLTPHPGEAARLLNTSVADVGEDRFASAERLQQRFGGTILLKGAGTLVASAETPLALVAAGNPGMATAGMGDILSGIIGALLAQGMPAKEAARLGALLHGRCGDDVASRQGEIGMAATDLLTVLPAVINGRV